MAMLASTPNCGAAWHTNTNALQCAKIFKAGWSPEKMLPLALGKS